MAAKKAKKTGKKAKGLRKPKKLEETKPLAMQAYMYVAGQKTGQIKG